MDPTFDPQTLADDLSEVHRIYADFLASLDGANWDRPARGGTKEWTLHETLAHLCALNGDGLESVKLALRGETYTFVGLESRYKFDAWNRKGIDEHLDLSLKELCARLLEILAEAAVIARDLHPDQAEQTAQMPIYNRPVKIVEALGIICFHAGLVHSAQVAEPVGHPPLWIELSPEIRHRVIGRVMRAMSLLYRPDIGGSLRATLAFRVDGPGGGNWLVELDPVAPTSAEGVVEHPDLLIHLHDTVVFCRMRTERLSLPIALIRGDMRLHGNLRLFLRMSPLFSIDARAPGVPAARVSSLPST